jgi:O-antigen ligase/tetratricopeptide (TPR) repeat protein
MKGDRRAWAVTGAALLAVVLAAGLEGGTEHRFGAVGMLVGCVAGALALSGPLPGFSRAAGAAALVLAGVVAFQAVPIPAGLRALIAPAQTVELHALAGAVPTDTTAWLTAASRFDLAVLLGESPAYDLDLLGAARDDHWRPLALTPAGQQWQVGMWASYVLLALAGWRIARHETTLRAFILGFVLVAVGEALFGFANRNGPSTGIGTKFAYLGSATGTFINRGHFAAFLNLAIGGLWGLAAAMFPLLPEEVRRHQARKRRSSQPPGLLEASGDKVPRLILITFVAALLFVAVVASNARGPLVGFVLAGLGVGAWAWRRRGETVHLGLGLGAPAAGLVLAIAALGLRGALGRFQSLGTGDVSYTFRVEIWRAALAAWGDSPLLGAGAGAWNAAFGPHERTPHLYEVSHAHSEPIELLVELGVVGLAAILVLGAAFLRGVYRRGDVVEVDFRTSVAFGALVGVLAVVLQSIADFPLRTPGLGVPFAIFVGIVVSALDIAPPGRARWPGWIVLGVAVATLAPAGIDDHTRGGTRAERRSESAPANLLPRATSAADAAAIRDDACGAAAREVFDAWQHLACGIAASRVAAARGSADDALQAEIAVTRALRLHPRDPRLQVQVAQVWIRLGPPTLLKHGFGERVTRLLMETVRLDGWRAEDAFTLARKLPEEAVDRIGGAASDEPVSRARTLYQYGVVLDERGRRDDARAAVEEAALADPQYGPPAFRAGVLARQADDREAARRWFGAFLAARDRPTAMEGWSLFFLDEPDAAEVRFRRALAQNDQNRWAWEGIAAVEAHRNDRDDECAAWRRVLAITPDHPQALKRVAELEC